MLCGGVVGGGGVTPSPPKPPWGPGGVRGRLGPEEAAVLPERGARPRVGGWGGERSSIVGQRSRHPPSPSKKLLTAKRSALWPLQGSPLRPRWGAQPGPGAEPWVYRSRPCAPPAPELKGRRWALGEGMGMGRANASRGRAGKPRTPLFVLPFLSVRPHVLWGCSGGGGGGGAPLCSAI